MNSSAEPSLTVEQAIANLKQKEDLGLRYYAAWWLGRFRIQREEAIEALLAALQDEADRAPDGGFPLRRNAAKALGKLGDARVVPALIDCLQCSDYYVRESAAQALEMLGDRRGIPPLMALLEGAAVQDGLSAQALTPVAGKPHLIQPYEAIIEALGTLGASAAIGRVKPFLGHTTPKVAYAAARAMYQLTREPAYGEILVAALSGEDLQLRRSALMDLGAIGYVGAAGAIAATLAENSLKLIALKGLLEHQVRQDAGGDFQISQASIDLMQLMDALL